MTLEHTTTRTDGIGDLSGTTTIVVGASRGLGHGIATAFADAGAAVLAVARTAAAYPEPANSTGSIVPEIADAGDATVAARLLDRYEPDAVILVAGAIPHMRPLQHQTWETFSVNWHTDVRIAFHWLREALLKPLRPGSRVVVFSSGAALNANGSPLSGGYAGAKATQRFITAYAQDEATRAGLGHQLHHGAAQVRAHGRRRRAGGPGVRGSRGPARGGIPRATRPAGHASDRRLGSSRTDTSRCRQRRPQLPADR